MRGDGSGFPRHAVAVLGGAGIVPLATGEACAVVFDTRAWAEHGEAAFSCLGPDERARAARFRFRADRDAYVMSHALWRAVLQVCLGSRTAPWDSLLLATHSSGQPWLPDHPAWAISLSRSGPFAAVAAAYAAWVGVDIERFPPRQSLEEVMATISTPAECDAIGRHVGEARARAMLQLWTDKEAVLKAWGTGLVLDPVRVDTLARPVQHPDREGRPCNLNVPALPPALVGALAAPPGLAGVRQVVLGPLGDRLGANSCTN